MARRTEAASPRNCEEYGIEFRPWKIDGRFCSSRCKGRSFYAKRLQPIAVPHPADSHEIAWAAGFVDGEGCIRATTGPRYETSDGIKTRRYLRLDVSQKHRPLLDRLQSTFGVGSIYYQKPRGTSSEGYKWVCNGRAAFHVADSLWPWLGEQKKSDFKRAIKMVRETRTDFVRLPQRGHRVLWGGEEVGTLPL